MIASTECSRSAAGGQAQEGEAGVVADEAHRGGDVGRAAVWVRQQHGVELLLVAEHVGEGGAVVHLGKDAEEGLVLGGDEALGQVPEEQDGAGHGRQGQAQHQAAVAQGEVQGLAIAPGQAGEAVLEEARQPPRPPPVCAP
jgi:hypothetical protein